ncbi:2-keto-4-pentenoate hydratase/2-oxohepta-3-ene-1,7-dioic acid hydratase in catechol pathway [Anseongella ginsenosidimutans]|uniref:2-keto-4-pentenoate hydratase/2-oxohepta-3-ene-1,7-dioic acid hydratase in catechol pathway n=1 Tax=Anseongella ginsenosidimutans TaxID=496056 RepID=A0A4R3L0A2_9SPHI|nr:fumarylacetoacetate hydrolase family protein [Anseongella ginsenosidimutans]QEC51008.1 fumarylacetoacetate hydrolase family protein [Anseongella ginsenosidimutans]TCS90340.1 2-keto-4-pentenoate hydratase/2-oxohepta-3-ene-1,7-dioic acid hydratase in catechol pathway [Anseongella ginsenosidimutans]
MKIIAVGRNYAEHARELNNAVPEEPVIFLKPDTALLKDNNAFYLPEFAQEIHHEIEVVVRVCKEGKHVPEKFAGNYINAVGLGIDFTARDLQQRLKEQGLPWERAKAFDHSAPLSSLRPVHGLEELRSLGFRLDINGKKVQEGNTEQMLFPVARLVSFISTFITLRKGDLIFTGTPSGVGKVAIGDHLEGYLEGEKLLDFYIK